MVDRHQACPMADRLVVTNTPKDDDNDSPPPHCKKRKADVLSRLHGAATLSGRGRDTGWTLCPLCTEVSKKRFAMGRGIAEHLHSVHSPWQPGKMERKKRQKLAQRNQTEYVEPQCWEPTQKERDDWDEKVAQILKELEQSNNDTIIPAGHDKTGQKQPSYRASLPPFLQAAADGDLQKLQSMVQQSKNSIAELLHTRDRHGSTAGHWAAGGGHMGTLQYLLELQERHGVTVTTTAAKPQRRRDGKTYLHYAARYGQVHCVEYLLSTKQHEYDIDCRSGDGTTAFHLSCFGGHLETAQLLVQHGANPKLVNDWGCNAAHWTALSKHPSVELCEYVHSCGASFFEVQKQGHSALHKAAQKQNQMVIEWMGSRLSKEERRLAGQPDQGGHLPSEIWTNVGGDAVFASKMKTEWGW